VSLNEASPLLFIGLEQLRGVPKAVERVLWHAATYPCENWASGFKNRREPRYPRLFGR
jgi:hypothetical protein